MRVLKIVVNVRAKYGNQLLQWDLDLSLRIGHLHKQVVYDFLDGLDLGLFHYLVLRHGYVFKILFEIDHKNIWKEFCEDVGELLIVIDFKES